MNAVHHETLRSREDADRYLSDAQREVDRDAHPGASAGGRGHHRCYFGDGFRRNVGILWCHDCGHGRGLNMVVRSWARANAIIEPATPKACVHAESSSNATNACAAYIIGGPPPMWTATPTTSSASSRVAFSLISDCTWKPMQSSQQHEIALPNAKSSRVFFDSAPSCVPAAPSAANADKRSGYDWRSLRICSATSAVHLRQ